MFENHEETLNVVITDSGYLVPIQRIGPITTPVRLSSSTIQQLINIGCHVYNAETGALITKAFAEQNTANIEVSSEPDSTQLKKNTEEEAASEPVEEKETKEDIPNNLCAANFVFDLNEDGTVNETNIPWSMFSSKGERKTLRARIHEINRAASSNTEDNQ